MIMGNKQTDKIKLKRKIIGAQKIAPIPEMIYKFEYILHQFISKPKDEKTKKIIITLIKGYIETIKIKNENVIDDYSISLNLPTPPSNQIILDIYVKFEFYKELAVFKYII